MSENLEGQVLTYIYAIPNYRIDLQHVNTM